MYFVSIFNCLSWFGLKNYVVNSLSFFPPKVKEKPAKPANQEKLMEASVGERAFPFIKEECYIIPLRNGSKTSGILYRNLYQNKKPFVMLFSHGNATSVELMRVFALNLSLRLKIDVFCYEYTGYGRFDQEKSSKKPSEETLLFDIEGAYLFLTKELKYDPSEILLYGQSLGSFPSVYLASNHHFPVKGVILHSPIASGLRILCPSLLGTRKNDFFMNVEMIKFIKCPLMIIHGDMDNVVDILHSKLLASMAQTLVLSWWVEGGGHDDIQIKKGKEFYQKLGCFLGILEGEEMKRAVAHEYEFSEIVNHFFSGFIKGFS